MLLSTGLDVLHCALSTSQIHRAKLRAKPKRGKQCVVGLSWAFLCQVGWRSTQGLNLTEQAQVSRGQCWELMLCLMPDGFVLSVFPSPPSAWSRGEVSLLLEPEEWEGVACPQGLAVTAGSWVLPGCLAGPFVWNKTHSQMCLSRQC